MRHIKVACCSIAFLILLFSCKKANKVPQGNANIQFIEYVSQELPLDNDLRIQFGYSNDLTLTYTVEPVGVGEKSDTNDWQLSFSCEKDNCEKPKVWFSRGKLSAKLEDNSGATRGKGLVLAVNRLVSRDLLRLPFVLRTVKLKDGWSFVFFQIPDVIGSDIGVEVSSDLKRIEVKGGH